MIYRIYPYKDTTIYEATDSKFQNTGKDEILEVTKFYDTLGGSNFIGNSRILIQFDLDEISNLINANIIPTSSEFVLNLTSTEQTEVLTEYSLEVYPISQSWSEGIGKYNYTPINVDGSSWINSVDGVNWQTSHVDTSVTSSWVLTEGGGNWFTSSINDTVYNQTFKKYVNDLNVEVTEYVYDWLFGNRDNNGFIIKRPDTNESDNVKYGSSKFFSTETHTIYVPTLEIRWDDSQFITGSLQPVNSDNILLYAKNLLKEYKEDSKARIRVVGRDRYPIKTFSNKSPQTDIKYLPIDTYYQVRDVETNLIIIPFSEYTKVSCDTTGNYFDFWFNTLQPERYYQFEFKVQTDTQVEYFNEYYFKVIR
jgi:hypothetical protein